MPEGYYTRSNEVSLSEISEIIKKIYVSTKGLPLEDLRIVGGLLNKAKDELRSGSFEKWVDAQEFPFSRPRRCRLMKLAANWDDIVEAVEALPEGKRRWSVDGVLAIWIASKQAATKGRSQQYGLSREVEKLRRELAETMGMVRKLWAENAELKVDNAELKADNEGLAAENEDLKAENEAMRAKAERVQPETNPAPPQPSGRWFRKARPKWLIK